MVPEEEDVKAVIEVEEEKAKGAIAPAFEKARAELADSDAAVEVGRAKGFGQLEERIPTLVLFGAGQKFQPRENSGPNDEFLFHEVCGGREQ